MTITPPSLPGEKPGVSWMDAMVLGLVLAFTYAVVATAREWSEPLRPVAEIHLEARYLPLYAVYSLARGVIAYGISFLFTLVYGYVMARVAGAERVMLPLLDILQSIPVLGFLPGFVLGLVHLFPHSNFGLELAAVLMIFTGQAWNMTFSFYSSLKSVPADLQAVARLAKMSWWERFVRLDLSHAAGGLVWNSMMSMAGGWFFLTVSEAFVLGDHDFRLPGLGSYMSLAIEKGDPVAQACGVVAMLAMVTVMDQLVWRPIVGWSQKFSESETSRAEDSWLWKPILKTRLWQAGTHSAHALFGQVNSAATAAAHISEGLGRRASGAPKWTKNLLLAAVGAGVIYGFALYIHLLTTLSGAEWLHLTTSAATTFGRVLLAVGLATLWTVPVGVMIGRRPALAEFLQPVIQIAASFPAPMIFPVVVGGMMALGAGLGVSSILLLMLGTQWYVLFNVIAGSSAIPRELWEVARMSRFRRAQRWRVVILPSIFPSLLTGWITAMGGAWNASIVAEYMKYKGQTLTTTGLGAAISQATEKGDFHVLGAAVGIMAVAVVGFNRVVWRPLSHLAQSRYNINS